MEKIVFMGGDPLTGKGMFEALSERADYDDIVLNIEALHPDVRGITFEIHLTEAGEIGGEFFEERGVNPSNRQTSKKRKKTII